MAILSELGDPKASALTEALHAHLEAIAGKPDPEAMARTVALEDELAAPPLSWRPRVLLAKQRRWAGELRSARTLREGGDSPTENQRSYRLYDLALIECAAGDFAAAGEIVRQGLEAARDAGDGFGERAFYYPHGLLQTWLGETEAARETVGVLLERALAVRELLDVVASRRILGLLALSEGDYESAVQELVEGARLLREIGIGNPGFYPVLPGRGRGAGPDGRSHRCPGAPRTSGESGQGRRERYRPPYVGSSGWIGVELDQVNDDALDGHIREAWQLIVKKDRSRRVK